MMQMKVQDVVLGLCPAPKTLFGPQGSVSLPRRLADSQQTSAC